MNITIVDQLPGISYYPQDVILTNNTNSSDLPLIPTLTGAGEILSWAIDPSLPTGLEFDTTTGIISGMPTEIMSQTMFTVTAENSGGPVMAYINITVLDSLPVIEYVPSVIELLYNSSVVDMSPISTGGPITGWEISPSLPAGLVFDNQTGEISGTPTEITVTTVYTITASNDRGSTDYELTITVQDIVYDTSLGPMYAVNGSELDPILPISTISGSHYEVYPDLPAGMVLNNSTGAISGTPTEITALANYTIYANSSLYNSSFTIEIGVLGDSDGDGQPDELPADYGGALVEDIDDDNDGYSDSAETGCSTDPLDETSSPSDLDGDGICDALDDDMDGDGISNSTEEENGTNPSSADSDGDGICDGSVVPVSPSDALCCWP